MRADFLFWTTDFHILPLHESIRYYLCFKHPNSNNIILRFSLSEYASHNQSIVVKYMAHVVARSRAHSQPTVFAPTNLFQSILSSTWVQNLSSFSQCVELGIVDSQFIPREEIAIILQHPDERILDGVKGTRLLDIAYAGRQHCMCFV